MSRSHSFASFAFVTLVTILAAAPSLAVPDVLTYAGSLRRGNVDADGTFAVVVSLFDAADGGAPLFTQSEPSLAVSAGELIVDLGSDPTNPLSEDVLAGGELFLSITVDGEELTPRVALSSVPFALQARFAEDSDSVGGLTAEDIASLYAAGDGLTKSGTTFSLATNAVTSVHIVDGSITGVDIASGAIVSSHIGNGAVNGAHVESGSLNGTHIASGSLNGTHIAGGSLNATHLASGSITNGLLASNAVISSNVAADAITNAALANDSVGSNEIQTSSVGTSEISNESITSADIGVSAVGTSEIIDNAISSVDILNSTISADDLGVGCVGSAELQTGSVTASKIANGQISAPHLESSGIRAFRPNAACSNNPTLTLADECIAGVCGGQFNFPTPAGCTCSGNATTQGTATCPNVLVGRLVRE